MEKEPFLFGQPEMVDERKTIAIATDTSRPFTRWQLAAFQKVALFLGTVKCAHRPWPSPIPAVPTPTRKLQVLISET